MDTHASYSTVDIYYRKCMEPNLLPMNMRFDLSDLVLFHKIVHQLIPMKIPEYIYQDTLVLQGCEIVT